MSAPRAPRGSSGTNGRSTPPPGFRGRGTGRSSVSTPFKGRGRGNGAAPSTNIRAEGLLQGLQSGSLNKKPMAETGNTQAGRGEKRPSVGKLPTELCLATSAEQQLKARAKQSLRSARLPLKGRTSTPRGPAQSHRGRGNLGNASITQSTRASTSSGSANPSHKDYMAEMTTKFQALKQRREGERAKAIRDGFLADPDKKTSLDKAITPVGTCTEMCPPFERVERIVQNMVERAEKTPNEATGRDMPAEERMIKRFRRSAAGYDEQLPSDIRTPATLQHTLDYLLDNVIAGGERLATIHKFVWDRTRGIRNDFSIQQVSRVEDVKIAVDCFERIARFHILSLHQLSNPDQLLEGENFDSYQEREQLNNTLLSLMYYYDDNRQKQTFPNEAEFRAYCIIFELQSQHPDLEDRMQSWPRQLLSDKRVQTAFKLYSAASNTLFDQGPLKPATPFSIAQGNSSTFWTLLKSNKVSYLMSCVAEIYFSQVRYLALQNLWQSHKGNSAQQARNQEWTVNELASALAFDFSEETLEFCYGYDLDFKTNENGVQYLDFTSRSSPLDQSSTPNKQVFSHGIVEAKRYRRTLVTVINGIGVAQAIREGLIVPDSDQHDDQDLSMGDESSEALFFPETTTPRSSIVQTRPLQQGPTIHQTQQGSTTSFAQPNALLPQPTSSGLATSTPFTWSIPSSQPGSSGSPPGFGMPSTPSVNTFGQNSQFPFTASTDVTAAPVTSPFTGFNFVKPTTIFAPTTSGPPGSFGQPSSMPSPFSPLPQQQDRKAQSFPSTQSSSPQPWGTPSTTPSNNFGSNRELAPQEPLPTLGSAGTTTPPSPQRLDLPSFQRQASLPSAPEDAPQQAFDQPGPLVPPASPRPSSLKLPDLGSNVPFVFPPSVPQQPQSRDTGNGFGFSTPGQSHMFNLPPNTADEQAPSIPPNNSTHSRADSDSPLSQASRSFQPATPTSPQWNFPTASTTPNNTTAISAPTTTVSTTAPLPLPSQFPKPTYPPRKASSSKVRPPTSKQHVPSPLRVEATFGDESNPFRQAAALSQKPPPPTRLPLSDNDRDIAANMVAELAMLQPDGLMSDYLNYMLPDLLRSAMQQHERDKPIFAARAARVRILAKKYCARWKVNTYRRALNRRARERRQKIEDNKKMTQKRMRNESELFAILEAKKEKERIQAEIFAREFRESSPQVPAPLVSQVNGVQQSAGRKRKSINGDHVESLIARDGPRKIAKGHKRSRTMGHEDDFPKLSRSSIGRDTIDSSPLPFRNSIFSGRSILNPGKSQDWRRSLSGRKDTTRTDYFRLKVRGIDPDTPMVPDTKGSLERKRQREEEVEESFRPRARTMSSSAKPPVPLFSPQSVVNNVMAAPNDLWQSKSTSQASPSASDSVAKVHDDDDDDFLRQIRKVRATLAADTDWFKTQAVQIEKEVGEQEELRRSASQASSRESPSFSISGMPIVNGHEYLPNNDTPDHSLSRTEQRIRRTGAHGLATKPIGGTTNYLAVPMSKQSARMFGYEVQSAFEAESVAEKKLKGKRKMGEKDTRYIQPESDDESEELENGVDSIPSHHAANLLQNGTRVSSTPEPAPPTVYYAQQDESVDEGSDNAQYDEEGEGDVYDEDRKGDAYEEELEVDDFVQESLEQPEQQYSRYDDLEGMRGGDGKGYEDGDDEGDEDLEEEEDELDELPNHQQRQLPKQGDYWLRSSVTPERALGDDRLTPNAGVRETSRASSGLGTGTGGTGASVDDAFVLDSD